MLTKKQKAILKRGRIKTFSDISPELWIELNEENKSADLEKDVVDELEVQCRK